MTLDEALKLSKPLKDMYESDEKVKISSTPPARSRACRATPRPTPPAFVITHRPVYEYVPLATNDGNPVTQYMMTTIEELGLLKMDFLGLRNLTVLEDAAKLVRQREPDFSIDTIPMDDPAVFDMLAAGKTSGVFQLESAGITGVCAALRPKSLEDITAVIALYRPGPMDSIRNFSSAASTRKRSVTSTRSSSRSSASPTAAWSIRSRCSRCSGACRILARPGGRHPPSNEQKKHAVIDAERVAFIHGDPVRNIPGCVANGVPEDVARAASMTRSSILPTTPSTKRMPFRTPSSPTARRI